MSDLRTNDPFDSAVPRRWRRLSSIIPIALLLVAGAAALVRGARPPVATTATRVTVLDVGQGDAILVDGPGDAEILVDGGPTPDLPHKLRRLLGNDRTIDLVILTHPHADHLVGMIPVLERYDVGRILMTGAIHTTEEYDRFLEVIRDRKIPTTVAVAGQTYDIGPSHLEILYPFDDLSGKRVENLNSSSVVAMLTVAKMTNDEIRMTNQTQNPNDEGSDTRSLGISAKGGSASRGDSTFDIRASSFRILLTGDAETDVEQAMLERYCADVLADASCPRLRADALKVPHHGSQDSSSPAFLDAVRPQHVIISAGAKNDYGHPHRRLLKRLERTSARVWRTDQHGDVTVTIGPAGLAVSSER
jgi:competence protein ComEC